MNNTLDFERKTLQSNPEYAQGLWFSSAILLLGCYRYISIDQTLIEAYNASVLEIEWTWGPVG